MRKRPNKKAFKKEKFQVLNDDIIYVSLYRKFQTLKTIIITPMDKYDFREK